MNRITFEIIENILNDELEKQGFDSAVALNEEDGNAYMYVLDDLAYSIKYQDSKSSFVLRSGSIQDGKVDTWKNLSSWLYDEEEGTKSDAESIGRDFLDIISGPMRIEKTKKAAKSKKSDERNIDAIFLFNRLVTFFPELKELVNQDRIKYGKIRYSTLTKSFIIPECEKLAKSKSENVKKFVELIDDMYKDGDLDTRAIIIHGIYNGVSLQTMDCFKEYFSEDMEKTYKCSKVLRNKNIKAEIPKKKNKIMANAMENAKQLEKERRANSK